MRGFLILAYCTVSAHKDYMFVYCAMNEWTECVPQICVSGLNDEDCSDVSTVQ